MKATKLIILACTILCLTTAAHAGKRDKDHYDKGKNHKKSAPEIDAGSASSALALLVNGLLVLHERRRRQ